MLYREKMGHRKRTLDYKEEKMNRYSFISGKTSVRESLILTTWTFALAR